MKTNFLDSFLMSFSICMLFWPMAVRGLAVYRCMCDMPILIYLSIHLSVDISKYMHACTHTYYTHTHTLSVCLSVRLSVRPSLMAVVVGNRQVILRMSDGVHTHTEHIHTQTHKQATSSNVCVSHHAPCLHISWHRHTQHAFAVFRISVTKPHLLQLGLVLFLSLFLCGSI